MLNKPDAALIPVRDNTDCRNTEVNETVHATTIKLRAFAAGRKRDELHFAGLCLLLDGRDCVEFTLNNYCEFRFRVVRIPEEFLVVVEAVESAKLTQLRIESVVNPLEIA